MECKDCGKEMKEEDLLKVRINKDGMQIYKIRCKRCDREKYRETYCRASKKWRDNNKDRTLEYSRTSKRRYNATERGKTDIYYSRLVYDALKYKWKKSGVWPFSYTMNELRSRLESQFSELMTWDNYGKNGWCVDHIIPKNRFEYNTVNDPGFHECWRLDNIQPLWFMDNLKKGSK